MSVTHRILGVPTISASSARSVLRVNAYLSIALGVVTLFLAGAIARGLGLDGPWLPVIAGVAILASGLDALGFAVGRRVRGRYFLPFAAVDVAACIAALIVLVESGAALSAGGRAVIALGAASLGWFAFADLRAMRSL